MVVDKKDMLTQRFNKAQELLNGKKRKKMLGAQKILYENLIRKYNQPISIKMLIQSVEESKNRKYSKQEFLRDIRKLVERVDLVEETEWLDTGIKYRIDLDNNNATLKLLHANKPSMKIDFYDDREHKDIEDISMPPDFKPDWPNLIRNKLFKVDVSDFGLFFSKGSLVFPFHLLSSPHKPEYRRKEHVFSAKADCTDCTICDSFLGDFQLPPELENIYELLLYHEIKDNRDKDLDHRRNDPEFKLQKCSIGPKNETLSLEFCMTTIHKFMLTNLSLDKRLLEDSTIPSIEKRFITIRDKYFPRFKSLTKLDKSCLSNRVGMNLLIFIEGGHKAVLTQRKETVTHDSNKHQVTVCGHVDFPDVSSDIIRGGKEGEAVPDPFVSASRLAEEKLGFRDKLKIHPDEIICRGIGVDYYIGIPHMFFDVHFPDMTLKEFNNILGGIIDTLEIVTPVRTVDFSDPQSFLNIFNYAIPGWEVECLVHCLMSFSHHSDYDDWDYLEKVIINWNKNKKHSDEWLSCRPAFFHSSCFKAN